MGSLLQLWVFFPFSFVAFFRTRRLSDHTPSAAFSLRPLGSLCQYEVYYWRHEYIGIGRTSFNLSSHHMLHVCTRVS